MYIFVRRLLVASSGVMMVAVANATTRSSFLDVDSTTDITFNATNGGLTVDVLLGANPTFTIGANTFHITSVIGFYALSDDDDLTVTSSNFGVWSTDNSNSGVGGIAGWKSNPNNGFGINNHQVFTYTALSTNRVEGLGLHVVTSELFPGTAGNTGNIAIVPEPTAIAALGFGLVGILARRRKK
jgi:PEP-CTERM motif